MSGGRTRGDAVRARATLPLPLPTQLIGSTLGPFVDSLAMSVPVEQSGEAIRFDEQGLVPCVMQDWRTGEVLTLAYMNEEALRLTRETGEMHFYSRSRDEIWHK